MTSSKLKRSKKDNQKQERPFLFYDFRRGNESWPKGVEVIDAQVMFAFSSTLN